VTTGAGRRRAWLAVVLALYAAALVWNRESIPHGLHNDTVEEAQRGMYLVEGRHFEVITTSIGNSAETLYLYLMGASIALLGPTTLAIQVVSWLFALACIWLFVLLARRLEPDLPAWVAPLLIVSSLWLFHYARAGLRAISSPVFLLAFVLLLDRAEHTASRWTALAAGAVLALSLYAYTSCRLLPLAFLAWLLLRSPLLPGAVPQNPPMYRDEVCRRRSLACVLATLCRPGRRLKPAPRGFEARRLKPETQPRPSS
jgi:hypothetical protein